MGCSLPEELGYKGNGDQGRDRDNQPEQGTPWSRRHRGISSPGAAMDLLYAAQKATC